MRLSVNKPKTFQPLKTIVIPWDTQQLRVKRAVLLFVWVCVGACVCESFIMAKSGSETHFSTKLNIVGFDLLLQNYSKVVHK